MATGCSRTARKFAGIDGKSRRVSLRKALTENRVMIRYWTYFVHYEISLTILQLVNIIAGGNVSLGTDTQYILPQSGENLWVLCQSIDRRSEQRCCLGASEL
jgi:hypothetical protein